MDDLDMPSMLKMVLVKKTEKKTELTGPYSLSCKQKIFKQFGICPIIL